MGKKAEVDNGEQEELLGDMTGVDDQFLHPRKRGSSLDRPKGDLRSAWDVGYAIGMLRGSKNFIEGSRSFHEYRDLFISASVDSYWPETRRKEHFYVSDEAAKIRTLKKLVKIGEKYEGKHDLIRECLTSHPKEEVLEKLCKSPWRIESGPFTQRLFTPRYIEGIRGLLMFEPLYGRRGGLVGYLAPARGSERDSFWKVEKGWDGKKLSVAMDACLQFYDKLKSYEDTVPHLIKGKEIDLKKKIARHKVDSRGWKKIISRLRNIDKLGVGVEATKKDKEVAGRVFRAGNYFRFSDMFPRLGECFSPDRVLTRIGKEPLRVCEQSKRGYVPSKFAKIVFPGVDHNALANDYHLSINLDRLLGVRGLNEISFETTRGEVED